MGTVPYVYISYDLIAIFFYFFFHFFHNFLLLFIIMFAKIALIVGLMICASINTEAKRRLPAPVSIKEKKPTTMRQLLDLIQGINKRVDNHFSAYPLDEERLHKEVQAMLYPVPALMFYLRR